MVFAPVRSGNGAKLSSAGLWLNASKPESMPEMTMYVLHVTRCVEIESLLTREPYVADWTGYAEMQSQFVCVFQFEYVQG